ncbi:hypothetical protein O181_067524 [Austropuccinia psidii MF-1]|uniref:Uncharacterized protein n=1 Tax=Austropuccinia psidii MF-1 TaxID=1389203 RepID=A0A9Q3EVI9_9BASI|nr:hypothetical protein [Austropuccinia psidii MF-1]
MTIYSDVFLEKRGTAIIDAIKKRSNKASWSSIIHPANLVFNSVDQQSNLVKHAINLGKAVKAIESQIRPLDGRKIIPLSPLLSIPQLQNKITSALDTRRAAAQPLDINVKDILNIVHHMTRKRKTPCNYLRMRSTTIIPIKERNSESAIRHQTHL